MQLALNGDEVSIDTLITQLIAETDPEKREVLRRALSSVTNAARVDSVLDYLTHSNDPDVARGIQLALAQMATPVITRRLGQAYNQVASDEAAVRIATAVEWTRSALCLPVLAEFLNAPGVPLQDRLSRASLRAITNLGTPYSVTILATRMEQATEEDATLLAGALAQIRGGGTEHELMAVAQGLRPETRRLETRLAAIKALGNYPLSLTRQALEVLSADADAQVAAAAKVVLQRPRRE
jgi:hypothetical protein